MLKMLNKLKNGEKFEWCKFSSELKRSQKILTNGKKLKNCEKFRKSNKIVKKPTNGEICWKTQNMVKNVKKCKKIKLKIV